MISVFFKFLFLFFCSLFLFCCGNSGGGTYTGETKVIDTKSSPEGALVFDKNCKICHGADGTLGLNGAKNLTLSSMPLPDRVLQITQGKNLMPAFKSMLTSEEINAVASYTLQLKKQ